MQKGPLMAIGFSLIALLSIYLFLDIKPKKEKKVVIEIVENGDLPDAINQFNQQLNPDNKQKLANYLDELDNGEKQYVDSIIQLYENLQQYNFAAFYHSLKASQSEDALLWELAGDRQYSVSSNDAYDPAFNQFLVQEAINSYQKAIELDSNLLDVQVKLGSIFVETSPQPMQGISLLMNVIEKDSMHVNANLSLGKFGIISGQYDKAIGRLEKVLSLQPQNTEALFFAAEAYKGLGNNQQAIVYLEKCQSLIDNEELKQEIDALMQQLL